VAAQQRRSRLLLLVEAFLLTRTVNEKMDVLAAWLPRSEGGEPWFDRRFSLRSIINGSCHGTLLRHF
jgi:hypothetical protein